MNQILEKLEKLREVELKFLGIPKVEGNIELIITFVNEASSIENELKLLLVEYDPANLLIEDNDIRHTLNT